MESIADKDIIMAKLWKLKYATNLEKVSITDDYTLEERRSIREMVDEGKRRNENDRKNGGGNDYAWKLRGNPRRGMQLVRVANRRQ